jgi:hypothetical protein
MPRPNVPKTDRAFAAFLASAAGRKAVNTSGNSVASDYRLDDEPARVGRHFGGHYTVEEVEALLADLRIVQAAWDVWNPDKEYDELLRLHTASRHTLRAALEAAKAARIRFSRGEISGEALLHASEKEAGAVIDAEEEDRAYAQAVAMLDAALKRR